MYRPEKNIIWLILSTVYSKISTDVSTIFYDLSTTFINGLWGDENGLPNRKYKKKLSS